MAQVQIKLKSGVPLVPQIVNEISRLIAAGSLEKGEKLPSVRVLGRQLGVNALTTMRAYQELAKAKLIELKAGKGAFVRGPRAGVSEQEQRATLEPEAKSLAGLAARLGASRELVLEIVKNELDALKSSGPDSNRPTV